MRFQEEMLAFTVKRILGNCLAELRDLGRDPAKLEPATETPYPKLRYGETLAICNQWRLVEAEKACPTLFKEIPIGTHEEVGQSVFEMWEEVIQSNILLSDSAFEDAKESEVLLRPFKWGDDFGAPDESAIGARYDKPVFVTNFPVEIKGFYFKDELDPDGSLKIDPVYERLKRDQPWLIVEGSTGHTVMGSDLIGSEGAGEMIGGSQREDDLARLEAKVAHHKLPREFFEWYLDTRRYGSVPHSGFGIGLERTIGWLCGGTDNPVHIRETITFPRMLHQLEP
jgi:aspartyl/asparaginyl-tRNA synthetase